jgi:hypothetical protein
VQEIGDFLEKLGMPEYGECFAQNKIDLSVLPNLTDRASAEDAGGHPGASWRVASSIENRTHRGGEGPRHRRASPISQRR